MDAVVIALIAVAPPTFAVGVAMWLLVRKLDSLHLEMNSRLDELLASATAEADAVGEARGRAAERDRDTG